ncbi:UDP-N-acetylmuramate--L-alanine ligase [Nonlabens marinus]|uniref:UDP-N-acetylmuramate--L-alanine ligase n=1 Tax=Nonlabens marinus S1-08 TaxID=1454201 RepID=W8VNA0_9FLAO|nr:UDP-N-acetylmuramate--L-alanine ligase [Nonlabens marinus]BAO54324.1 UDP-N-acetylmuramate--alanine ligase [Nonlabens marinus S1-08]
MRDLKDITHFYFVGIGGIGMSALARYLHAQGKTVSGYDRVITSLSKKLETEGITIHYDDNYEVIPAEFKNPDTAQVVYTPAVPQGFGEMVRFRESGIPITKRAQLLGQISKTMTCLAIAGTHGKTTTSAILAHLLYNSEVKMTAFLGGILEGYQTNYLNSGTDVMVVEADEFDRSFLQLQPDYAGITAIDPDHLDIYGSAEAFEESFKEFAGLVSKDKLFVNTAIKWEAATVGVENGDFHAEHLTIVDGAYHFDFHTPDSIVKNFYLKLPGRHNLANALLALSIAHQYGVAIEKLRTALASFQGVERRFSYRIDTLERVLIDDYAHHPTEIDAVYHAVAEMYPGEKYTVIFQPHLYSRTNDFMEDFARSLSQFDCVGILDIYAAREEPMEGVDSAVLCQRIGEQENAPVVSTVVQKTDLAEFIEEMDNRIVLMLGAGDIGVEVERVKEKLSQ